MAKKPAEPDKALAAEEPETETSAPTTAPLPKNSKKHRIVSAKDQRTLVYAYDTRTGDRLPNRVSRAFLSRFSYLREVPSTDPKGGK